MVSTWSRSSAVVDISFCLLSFFSLIFFPLLTFSEVVTVSSSAALANAVNAANNSGGNTTISLQNGTYTLSDTLYVNAPNITITSQSGDRTKVIIQGDAMSGSANVGNLIRAAASNFQISNVTLQKSRWHLLQIVGENDADSPIVSNCIFRDAYEQMLKVTVNPDNLNISSDSGLVENCLFEYTAGIGPQYYIGGIDAHASKNWTIRNNTFKNIISPNTSVAEFAIHFWNGSANNLIEKNIIINCDRGIGFGLETRGNSGGIIRNNMIFHSANLGSFADVGIALAESPGTSIYNNTILQKHSFPWAIEYRFSSTSNVGIFNNLTNKPIQARDGASGSSGNNLTNAQDSWFIAPATGNLHLNAPESSVIDHGQAITGLSDDIDGDIRPQGSGIDLGADEYLVSRTVQAPGNLRLNN